jgi:hypothetical protein
MKTLMRKMGLEIKKSNSGNNDDNDDVDGDRLRH